MTQEQLNRLSQEILDACLAVHREMGPGLLESVYEICLMKELELRGIKARNQILVPLHYKGYALPKELRLDVLVEKEVIIEIKSAEIMLPVHKAQIISHLKLANKKLGFLVNFNVPLLKDGFKRFVNNF